jgi:hypothetical protein
VSSISIPVETAVLRRLMLLKHLPNMPLSTEAGLALIQRVDTNSDSAADQATVITVIRATQAAQQLEEAPPLLSQPAPKRKAKRK